MEDSVQVGEGKGAKEDRDGVRKTKMGESS